MQRLKSVLIGLTLIVSACGGSGGSDQPPIVVPQTPAPPAGIVTNGYPGFSFGVASGGVGPFTWAVTVGSVPPGLTLDPDGALYGTPTAAGSFAFTVAATDSVPPYASGFQSFTVTITPPGPPVITQGQTPPAGVHGTPYGFNFTAGGGLLPLTWTVTAGAPPPGLTLGTDGSLTGTPTATGSFTFTVTATETAPTPASSSQSFTVIVTAPGPPVITQGQVPPPGVHGTPYWFNFTADAGLAPLIWTVSAGAVPPGLVLGADGLLTGTPATVTGSPFAFTLTVTDSSTPPQVAVPVAYSIAVSEPPPPVIHPDPRPPTATVGVNYPPFAFAYDGGLAPLVWTLPAAPTGGLAVSLDGVLSGTPTTAGIFPITLTATDALNQSSPPTPFTLRVALARPAAAFTPVPGTMAVARDWHTATLMQNGQVLIAGGSDANAALAAAEVYDATSQTFTVTGSMTVARVGHSATLLANPKLANSGKVLIAGGRQLAAELFDPTAGTFTATGSPRAYHMGPTATLLENGQVLIAGGETAAAELFDPATGTFKATGDMTASRSGHTATLLPDGRVLIAGGLQNFGPMGTWPVPASPGVPSAELYDPVSGSFTPIGSMTEGRSGHTATLLADGTVLVTGPDSTAELYSPGTGTFSAAGDLIESRCGATATLLADSTVLVAGGYGCTSRVTSSSATAELFAPESGGFVPTGPLNTARDGHAATRLADHSVLITGGATRTVRCGRGHCGTSTVLLSSAELFK